MALSAVKSGGEGSVSRKSAQMEPSLAQLLALAKQNADLSKSIFEAARLAGLHEEWHVFPNTPRFTSETSREESEGVSVSHARAEWVLRWILDKLKLENDEGREARCNKDAWILLLRVLAVIPISKAARHLNQASFLTAFETTLTENVPQWNQPGILETGGLPVMLESKASLEDEQSAWKRRKRQNNGKEKVRESMEGNNSQIPCDIVRSMAPVLNFISSTAGGRSGDENATAREYMRSALRTTPANAANILSLWVTSFLIMGCQNEKPTLESGQVDSSSLCDILSIWNAKAIQDDREHEEEFASKCYIPICLLLSCSFDPRRQEDDDDEASSPPHIPAFEQLLGKYIFAESRRDFGTAHETRKYFSPLATAIASESKSIDSQNSRPLRYELLMKSVPTLFSMAVRCMNRATHTSRQAESPWIQSVFSDLLSCVGLPLVGDEVSFNEAEASELLKTMLILWPEDMVMPLKILTEIVKRYTGIYVAISPKQPVNWSLLAKVVEINYTLFDRQRETSDLERLDDDKILGDVLFAKITDEKCCRDYNQRKSSQTNKGHTTRHLIKQSIIIPILRGDGYPRSPKVFLERWYTQLAAAFLDSEEPWNISSIWEDHDLMVSAKSTLDRYLSGNERSDLITRYRNDIQIFIESKKTAHGWHAQKERPTRSVMASLTLLELILPQNKLTGWAEPRLETLTALEETMRSLVQDPLACKTIDMIKVWTVYSLLHFYLWPAVFRTASFEEPELVLRSPVFELAYQIAASPSEPLSYASMVKHAASYFVLSICSALRVHTQLDNSIKKRVLGILEASAIVQIPSSFTTIHSKEQFLSYLMVYEAFVPHLSVVEILDTGRRAEFFSGLLMLACVVRLKIIRIKPEIDTISDRAITVFTAIFQRSLRTTSEPVKKQCIEILCTAFEDKAFGQFQARDLSSVHEVVEKIILDTPVQMFDRTQRRDLLEWATKKLLDHATWIEMLNAYRVMSLFIKFVASPVPTATILTDANVVWKIAEAANQSQREIEDIRLFDESVKLALHFVDTRKKSEVASRFLRVFHKNLKRIMELDDMTKVPATLIVIKNHIWGLRPAYSPADLIPRKIEDKLHGSLRQGIDSLLRIQRVSESREHLAALHSVLEASAALIANGTLCASPDMRRILYKSILDEIFHNLNTFPPMVIQFSANILPSDDDVGEHSCVEKFLSTAQKALSKNEEGWAPEPADVNLILKSCGGAFASLRAETKFRFAMRLLERCDDSYTNWRHLQLLSELLPTLQSAETGPAADGECARILSSLAVLLRDPHMLLSSIVRCIECILTVLDLPHNSVNQSSVDDLLASAHALVLQSRNGKPGDQAAYIHSSLCRILTMLASLYRKNIGGRFHLLIPALQVLLSCFFVPAVSSPQPSSEFVLPAWSKSGLTRLNKDNAIVYTRLLTTLCEPTVSSARGLSRRKESNEDLVDARKKAKAYAGQHVQYLIMHFCAAELNGTLDPNLREQLTPGLYACIDAVGEEGLRSMNASLDHSSRAIWRNLYSDWTQFGKRKGR